jgi:hypothetical protein
MNSFNLWSRTLLLGIVKLRLQKLAPGRRNAFALPTQQLSLDPRVKVRRAESVAERRGDTLCE